MKRIATLLIVAASILLMRANDSNSIDYTQLYIVGDATETGWDTDKADQLSNISYGVFEWTGKLFGNSEFKFINSRKGFHKHIVCSEKDVVAEIGKEYSLNFVANSNILPYEDFKLKVAKTGRYSIVVDLIAMRIVITEPVESAKWPKEFYIVGPSTKDQVFQIENCNNIELKKAVYLRKGIVKLINTPTITENTKYYIPRLQDVDIAFTQDCPVKLYEGTKDSDGWHVNQPGYYIISLDTEHQTMSCKKHASYPNLYIVGGCTEHAWNAYADSNNSFRPDADDPDIMVWEGELRKGWEKVSDGKGGLKDPANPDKFKIITYQDVNAPAFHPYTAGVDAEGTSKAHLGTGLTAMWSIKRDGYFRLVFDTYHETLKGQYLGTDANHIAPESEAGIETVDIEECPSNYVYYNLQGIRVEEPTTGLYIVSDGIKTFKLFVK